MTDAPFPLTFRPIEVGTLRLDHRIVVPPHGGGNGNLLGSAAEFEQHCALWLAKVRGGVQWVGGGPNFVANPLPPGFEPTGVGAHGPGFFRDPQYPQRIGEFARRVHDAGGVLSVQMVLQGGMPIGPSATFSGYADHRIAHALDTDEIAWLVREYAESAAIAVAAGVDAIEIHANHDDVVQWFLSPATNRRTDAYGGNFANRRRFLSEIVEAIRSTVATPFTFGLRLNLDEMIEGGYAIDGCQQLVEAFTADGLVDYFSFDVGGNWDAPSYIPIPWYDDAQWAALCGQAKQATHLPVVYAGRVRTVAQAEAVLAAGHADLVAMARATMADPDLVNKARGLDPLPQRPCIGLNECIHRKQVEGLRYACGVSTSFAREAELAGRPPRTRTPLDVLVVGGGPAGSELAAQCAEQGHRVRLWERSGTIGGAINIARLARGNRTYGDWVAWQADRLARLGVDVRLGRAAAADDVAAAGADLVAICTGASPRIPPIPGVDQPHVFTAAAALRLTAALTVANLSGQESNSAEHVTTSSGSGSGSGTGGGGGPGGGGGLGLGRHVVVIAEDDGPAPLSVSDHLAGLGHRVTLIHQSAAPSPLVGKYSNGGMFARLIDGGVELLAMTRVVGIDGPKLELASSYGTRRSTLEGVDSVVLCAGSIPDDTLYRQLKGRVPRLHVLGDAFAPRRMVFATRQASALAETLR